MVEAVAPGSMEAAWEAWEPQLCANGYRFAFFDSLNRFYVAEERRGGGALPGSPRPGTRSGTCGTTAARRNKPTIPTTPRRKCCWSGFFAMLPSLDPALLKAIVERGVQTAGQGRLRVWQP